MRTKFDEALAFTLKWEGGYNFDSDDPGGATNHGVSLRFLENKPLDLADIDGDGVITWRDVLAMPAERAAEIYRKYFWDYLSLGGLPGRVSTVCFDTAVNCGCSRASRWLQGAVGVVQDGSIGPKTIAAVNASPDEAIRGLFTSRADHYVVIVAKNPTLRKFLKGWTNRLDALRNEVGL